MIRNPFKYAIPAFGFISAAAAALNSFFSLSGFLLMHFLAVFSFGFALLIYSFWPKRQVSESLMGFRIVGARSSERIDLLQLIKRFSLCIILAAVYVGGVAIFEWETRWRKVDDHFTIPPDVGTSWMDWVVGRAYAQDSALTLERFSLKREYTSFVEKDNFDFTTGAGIQLKTFEMNSAFMDGQKEDGWCLPQVTEIFSDSMEADESTVLAFYHYFDVADKKTLSPYLDVDINQDFVGRRPDIVREMIPSKAEFARLEADGLEGRSAAKIIRNWIKYCIGIPYPTFEFVLRNNSSISDIVLTKMIFDVESIGGYKGFEPGTLIPSATYVFDLPYEAGKIARNLDPAFVIPKGQVASVLLRLYTTHKDVGLAWKMRVNIESSGGEVSTEQFQLLMSGDPDWAPSRMK